MATRSAKIDQKADLIWAIADKLTGVYKPHEYGDVILPLTVIRRFDCILSDTKDAVLQKYDEVKNLPMKDILLRKASKKDFYNTSKYTFERLMDDPDHIEENFREYLNKFSANVRDILEKFKFDGHITTMANKGILYIVLKEYTTDRGNLHPNEISNLEMGYIFEEIIRRFSESHNEDAGQHYTPREVIQLMVNILFYDDNDILSGNNVAKTIYDPACGTGGMLSVAEEYLHSLNASTELVSFGQEINDQTFAICKADMLIKGNNADYIKDGNTLSDDQFAGSTFDYILSNPPFGREWKNEKAKVEEEAKLGFGGRFGAGLPAASDGQMLFLMTAISKMKDIDKGGSRIAIIHNGSPLFGEALLAVGPEAAVKKIEDAVASNMQDWGKRYPHAGYGGSFRHWLKENNPKPYGSYGNGSAMRVSAVGWLYDSMERTREVARATANVTHNHPEGIKGAESTASAIYMARNGSSKEEIKTYIEREFHYDLSRTLDNIRTYYHHVESCQETVPEAIIAFLESKDFEDAIRNAVSLGGDTDTLGAITGSIAEAFYGIPAVLIAECKSRIDKGLMTDVLDEFDHVLGRSVDTYSDEVDETQANQMIEAAIDQYYIQQDKNGMLLFMEVMVTRMQQAGEVIVPYITENPFMSEEQISKVKAGDTISLDHDVRLKIETVKDSDEKEWIGVFTSSEEMHKGSAGNVQMNQSIESILRLALNWEQVNGIVINPFGKYIQMTKKMIELLINGYEYNENERKSKDDENN